MERYRFALLIVPIVAAGCRSMDSAVEPVVLPPAAEITAIKVTPNSGARRETVAVVDSARIGEFVAFVNSRQDGWRYPRDTFPGGTHTVSVKRGKETVAVFWPGGEHLGGRGGEGAPTNRLRPLSREEWVELKTILGLDAMME